MVAKAIPLPTGLKNPYASAAAREEAQKRTALEHAKKWQRAAKIAGHFSVGKVIEDGSIFLRLLSVPSNLFGDIRIYKIFAAPKDLTNRVGYSAFTFQEAAKELAGKKNWFGHDGGYFINSNAVYSALSCREFVNYGNNPVGKDGVYAPYEKHLFIPPSEILFGVKYPLWSIKAQEKTIHGPNLFSAKDIGGFKGTFPTSPNNGLTRYGSSTPGSSGKADVRRYIDFVNGSVGEEHIDGGRAARMKWRPCWAEPVI